ncbi:MAG TPA: M14 family metallopeptidase [Vicinamibacterales bacterium]|nr:M14 family metallopeptidase [Vicinamibacterales bacterium]
MRIRALLRAACVAAAGCAFVASAGQAPLSAADYSKYHTHEQLTAALRDLAAKHARLAKLVEVAKSREGRTVWAIEIANPAGTPVAERPALLIAANLEGDQVIGSALALYVAEHLLTAYASDPAVKQRLDSHVFYIVPRVNPDGAEAMFGPVKAGLKTNAAKFDNDNDGRVDEDGPEDLNKDGFISVMRVKDPKGPYMIHPEDPRLMRRADPAKGEAGGYAIYWEGIDNDGDGFINEDPAGGVDLNRNFQHQYPYYTPDAGPHMVSEPEVRGLLDYVLARRNIAAILTFGESDNLIAPPTRTGAHAPASTVDLVAFANQSVEGARNVGRFQSPQQPFFAGGRGGGDDEGRGGAPAGRGGQPRPTPPATTVAPADVEYFRTISDRYRQLTGIRTAPPTRIPGGAFFEYGYYQFGVPSFSTPGWGIQVPQGGPGTAGAPGGQAAPGGRGGAPGAPGGAAGAAPGGDAPEAGTAAFDLRLARWMDAEKVDGFIPWQPFKHPTLGDVEIGGFRPYALSNPDPAAIPDLGKSHAAFVTYVSSLLPKIAIADTSVTSLGGGLYRIKAEVENSGFLPTATAQGVRSRAVAPTMVQLGVPPDDIVSGAPKTNFFPALAGSGRRQAYEWIVKGKPGSTVTVKAVAQKGGTATASVTLK